MFGIGGKNIYQERKNLKSRIMRAVLLPPRNITIPHLAVSGNFSKIFSVLFVVMYEFTKEIYFTLSFNPPNRPLDFI